MRRRGKVLIEERMKTRKRKIGGRRRVENNEKVAAGRKIGEKEEKEEKQEFNKN